MKIHFCCGDIYLKGYLNIDIHGILLDEWTELNGPINPNQTTLEKYFKYPFGSPPRPFILDKKLNILDVWPFANRTVDEVVMISCIEHFDNKTEVPFIVSQVKRVLKHGGKWKVDFPDIINTVSKYYDENPDFCMELIYCNRKNKYSEHKWGYNEDSFSNLIGSGWGKVSFEQVVKHDYPMIGCVATRG